MRFLAFLIAFFFMGYLHAQLPAPARYVQGIHKTDTFRKAAVVSAHRLASNAGVEILKKGGNAFDAAVATQLALAVVYPNAGNLGGGGFLLGRRTNGQLVCIDYRETAPAGASRDMYLDKQGNPVTSKSLNGHLAAGVPGTPAGLEATLPYCKLPWHQLIAPAIKLAEKGFTLTAREANAYNDLREKLPLYNTRPNAFLRSKNWIQGDTLRQPELAATLRRMQQKGSREFYTGITATLIEAEMKRGKGLITRADLAAYRARLRKPVLFNYKGYDIIGFPPPSSGGILLAQMLGMLSIQSFPHPAFHHAENVHLMAEIERRAYADRAEYLGDPDFFRVPVETLISRAYLKQRIKDFQPGKAGSSDLIRAGIIDKVSEETTHISIFDMAGNMVSVTTTLNNSYGSLTFVGGAGFLLNDEMDDFSSKPGSPNMYGAIGGEANAIAPGKRMLSSMTPTLVLKSGKPFVVVGTPGGTTISTSVFQSIVNVIDFGQSCYEAVNNPKFHHQWKPDQIFVEPSFPEKLRQKLSILGHKVVERGPIGRTEMIRILPDGSIEACADGRGEDAIAGY